MTENEFTDENEGQVFFDYTDEAEHNGYNATIKVMGAGGGGGNAVSTMFKEGVTGVEFIVANTDAQALKASPVPNKLQIGRQITKGLGAGGRPDIGRAAAQEDSESIRAMLDGADMVFVTAGMGGGTGTGAAPIVAAIAKEMGALTVGVVTKPFSFEGKRRAQLAEQGLTEFRKNVDTLITIPNQQLLSYVSKKMPATEAFAIADGILCKAVKGISELITVGGIVNLDFADVQTIMSAKGMALMGTGVGTGENRAVEAADNAINSPLLEDSSIAGAKGILINVTGGEDLSLHEIDEAASLITDSADPDAQIIFGAVINKSLNDTVSVTVIATGFRSAQEVKRADDFRMNEESMNPERRDKLKGIINNRLRDHDQSMDMPVFNKGPRKGRPILKEVRMDLPPIDDDLDIPTFIRKHAD
ncbi:Cell division protein FtsZ [hydrothermal vent metagenome]|uniref:Cell division protein FtsZ n=1 Tax=hydrothermal vent metagenome TaxID=652676 RepID=A0A3B1BVP5_9ZZZZ